MSNILNLTMNTIDLPNIIYLYSLINSNEGDTLRALPLPQEELKALQWKPTVINCKPRITTEHYLEKNLSGFFRYMLEYPEF